MKLSRFILISGLLATMLFTLSGCSGLIGRALEPAIESAAKPVIKEIAEKTVKELAEQTAKEMAQQGAQEIVEKTAKEAAEKLAQEAIEQASAEALEASVKRTAGIGIVADLLGEGRTPDQIVEALGRQGDQIPVIHALSDSSHLVSLNGLSYRVLEGEIIPIPDPTIIALDGQERLLKINQGWLWTNGEQAKAVANPLDIMTSAKMSESYLLFEPAKQGDAVFSVVARDQAPQAEHMIEVEYLIDQRTVKAFVNSETGVHYITFEEFPADADAILKQIQHSYTSFEQNARNMDYRRLARDLTDPSGNGVELLTLDLKRRMDAVDALFDEGSYDDALKLLDSMSALHGDTPEILLRRSLVFIKKRDAPRLVAELNNSPVRQFFDSDTYFDEINLRLSDGTLSSDLERENLQRVGQFAEWNDLHAQNNIAEQVGALTTDDGHLTLLYGLRDDLPETKIAKNDLSLNPTAVYYTEDAPGIYSLNLDVSSEASLHRLIEGELIDVVELQRGDIANFRPVLIYRGNYEETVSTISKDYPNIMSQLVRNAEREGVELSTRKFYESYERAKQANASGEGIVYLISTRTE